MPGYWLQCLFFPVLPKSDVSPYKLKLSLAAHGSSRYSSCQGKIWQSFKIILDFDFGCFEVKSPFSGSKHILALIANVGKIK